MAHPVYLKNEKLNRTFNEIIPNTHHSAFVFRIFKDKYIYDYRHLHSDFELIYIKQGNGNKNIGDIEQVCRKNDLSLIGSAIPHYYHLNPEKHEAFTEVWVIHFDKHIFGSAFLDYSENKMLNKMFDDATKGIQFNTNTGSKAFQLMKKIKTAKQNERIILFMQLLTILSNPKSYSILLNTYKASSIHEDVSDDRLSRVINYVEKKYNQTISIEEMAKLIHLSKPSFCNLFKKRFNICFSEYVNEIRISRASKLLAETDLQIRDICDRCGFQNQTYFNRVFKKHFGINPAMYRKMLNGNIIKHKTG